MKILKIMIFHDFSTKFCIAMRIILRVTRAPDNEFQDSSSSIFACFLSRASCVRVCSFLMYSGFCSSFGAMLRLLQFIWINAAAPEVDFDALMRSYAIRDAVLLRIDMHLLNNLPRGNLVDGLPRAAS